MKVTGALKTLALGALLLTSPIATLFGQNASERADSGSIFSVRATHLLGFEGAEKNSTGTLPIQNGVLRFQRGNKPAAEVTIASVQDVFLGGESKQVGGLPMTLGKAAVPFGGGRVVSLFAHKKYDTLTVEYVDADGGIHGAIFQMAEGRAAEFRQELVARGVPPGVREDRLAEPSTAETSYENQ